MEGVFGNRSPVSTAPHRLVRQGHHPRYLKLFYKVLRQEQDQQRCYFDLVAYANQQVETDKGETFTFIPADHQDPTPDAPLDADELAAMRAIAATCDGIGAPDLELIWSTDVESKTIREFMEARSLATGNKVADDQAFQRLKKRRQRARERLRAYLRDSEPR